MKKKVATVILSLIALAIAGGLISIPVRQYTSLRSLEKEVNQIALPQNIEKTALKSAKGDSGGNGDQTSLRSVLVVKTDLSIDELKTEIENMNLYFPKHFKSVDHRPIMYITRCEGSTFQSPRDFSLYFEDLEIVTDFSSYYFIEFVE